MSTPDPEPYDWVDDAIANRRRSQRWGAALLVFNGAITLWHVWLLFFAGSWISLLVVGANIAVVGLMLRSQLRYAATVDRAILAREKRRMLDEDS